MTISSNILSFRGIRQTIQEARKLTNSFMVVSLLLNLARMFTGLICIRWISPEQMGIWQLMILIESYLMFARFGIFNSLNRELPFYLGRNRAEKAMKYHDAAEGYAILVSFLFLIALLVSLFFYNPPIVYWKECMLVFATYLPFKFYSGFIELTFRSGRDFRKLAVVQLILIVFTVLSVWLVYFFGFEGYLARVVVLAVIGLILMVWFRPFRFRANLNIQYLKQLFRMGMPLFVSNYGQTIINSFPGMLILFFGNIATLGMFYPVSILMSFGTLVPGIISTYLYPQISFDFGANRNVKEVIRKSVTAGFSAMMIMIPIIVMMYFLLPQIFYRFAPQYSNAIVVCKWALLFSLVSCMNLFYNPYAILKAWKPMYIYLIISGIVTWCIPYLFMSNSEPHNILLALVLSLLLVRVLLSIINYVSIQMIHRLALS